MTFDGTGTLLPGRRVRIDPVAGAGEASGPIEITGRDVVLATGSVPRTIPGFDVDGRVVLTSDDVLMLDALPASVAVIGGGAIGCEFASMFSDLGSQVTVLEALPSLLTGCDSDVVGVVARSFRKRGINVHTGVTVSGHAPQRGGDDGELRGGRVRHGGRRGVVGRSAAVDRGVAGGGHGSDHRRAGVRRRRRVSADRGARRVGGRRCGEHAATRACGLRRGDPGHQGDAGRARRPGGVRRVPWASTAIRRSPSWG